MRWGSGRRVYNRVANSEKTNGLQKKGDIDSTILQACANVLNCKRSDHCERTRQVREWAHLDESASLPTRCCQSSVSSEIANAHDFSMLITMGSVRALACVFQNLIEGGIVVVHDRRPRRAENSRSSGGERVC